jgi:chloride channel 3/4/5
VIKKILGFQTLVIKSVGLVLSVGSGLCVGKDAPFVHIAACCGNIFTRLFDKYEKNESKYLI